MHWVVHVMLCGAVPTSCGCAHETTTNPPSPAAVAVCPGVLQLHSIPSKVNGKDNKVIGDLNRSVITLLCAMLEGCVVTDASLHLCVTLLARMGRQM